MELAFLVCRSSVYLTQGCGGLSLSLSHRWSLIRPHPVRRGKGVRWPLSLSHCWSLIRPHLVRRGKGRKCIVSPFDGAEAARPDLRYTPVLSDQAPARQGLRHLLTYSARRRSPSYIPTTSRYPLRLAPLPVFPRRCMWIFHSSLPKT